jgi:excisionase family DNA binding protein
VEVIDMIGKKYYTAKEIANTLAVTPMTIYRLAERGKLKAIRVGKSIRFDANDVESFLKNSSMKKNTKSNETEDIKEQERIARIKAVRGMFAHLPGSVEDFMREKQKDIEIEKRRWKDE